MPAAHVLLVVNTAHFVPQPRHAPAGEYMHFKWRTIPATMQHRCKNTTQCSAAGNMRIVTFLCRIAATLSWATS